MAFIRSYARQGDPLGTAFYRAGVLTRGAMNPARRGPGITPTLHTKFFTPSHPSGYLRSQLLAGDPFLGKLFKGIKKAAKKITLKGVVKGVGTVAKFAAPLVLGGGVGALAAGLLGGGGGSAPQEAAPVAYEPAPPAFDQQAAFRAMLEQWIAEQQAQQAQQEAAALAQWQVMQGFQNPSFAPNAWRF
jgi:hypothetical protein